MLLTKSIAEQLTDIYLRYSYWDKVSHEEALRYFQSKLDNGDIVYYIKDGIVLGYYERYLYDNTCFFCNGFILPEVRKGGVFKELYGYFFKTLPKHITKMVFQQQKSGGRFVERTITEARRRNYGNSD